MLIDDGCVGQVLAADGVRSEVRLLTQEKVRHHTLCDVDAITYCDVDAITYGDVDAITYGGVDDAPLTIHFSES